MRQVDERQERRTLQEDLHKIVNPVSLSVSLHVRLWSLINLWEVPVYITNLY